MANRLDAPSTPCQSPIKVCLECAKLTYRKHAKSKPWKTQLDSTRNRKMWLKQSSFQFVWATNVRVTRPPFNTAKVYKAYSYNSSNGGPWCSHCATCANVSKGSAKCPPHVRAPVTIWTATSCRRMPFQFFQKFIYSTFYQSKRWTTTSLL